MIREDIKMGRKTLETVLRESGLVEDWEAQVEARLRPQIERRSLEKTAKNALNEGASLDFVQKITGLDLETVKSLVQR
jgi:hypothetical protein